MALPGGGYLLGLCDGMGTGAAAAVESQDTVAMLRRFYEAGFPQETVLESLNHIMLLRGARERCCTVDLCTVDTAEGEASFVKLGAAPSYIVRGGQVSMVHDPALPLGMLEGVQRCVVRRVLMDGDVIVLLSDGIATGDAEDEAWLQDLLRGLCALPPRRAARAIVEAAALRFGRKDDMTALVAAVSRHPTLRVVGAAEKWRSRVRGALPARMARQA